MPYGKPGSMTMHTVASLTARTIPEPNTGCWLYTGALDRRGYGRIRNGPGSASMLPHRLMYELVTGVKPEGLEVCHRCDNPPCCNPDHLFAGTHAENMKDSARKNRTRRGERVKASRAKLSVSDVVAIRAALRGGTSRTALAATYGVTRPAIRAIHLNHSWRYLENT